MKRSYFLLAAGALALSACTSQEVIEESTQKTAIGFKHVVAKESRNNDAQELNAETLKQFNVFGYYLNPNVTTQGVLVFNNEPITKSETTTDENGQFVWTYENTRFWVPNATYYFYAYSCGNVSKLGSEFGTFSMDVNGSSESDRALQIHDYLCDQSHQHDLLLASATGIRPATDALGNISAAADVPFNFKHILAKIETKFESAFAPEYQVEIKNVRATNIRNIGDYWPGKDWKNQNRKNMADGNTPYIQIHGSNPIIAQKGGTKKDVNGKEITYEPMVAESETSFVIPHTYTSGEVTLSFEITVKTPDVNGDYQLLMSRTITGSWKPTWETGHWYTYKIIIDGDATNLKPIMFTIDTNVEGWTKGETPSDIKFSAN